MEEENEQSTDDIHDPDLHSASCIQFYNSINSINKWSVLIVNAERIFVGILENNKLPRTEQNAIRSWLDTNILYEQCIINNGIPVRMLRKLLLKIKQWVEHKRIFKELVETYNRFHEHHNLGAEEAPEIHTWIEDEDTYNMRTYAPLVESNDTTVFFRFVNIFEHFDHLVQTAKHLLETLVTSEAISYKWQNEVELWLCICEEYEETLFFDDPEYVLEMTRKTLQRLQETRHEHAHQNIRDATKTDKKTRHISDDQKVRKATKIDKMIRHESSHQKVRKATKSDKKIRHISDDQKVRKATKTDKMIRHESAHRMKGKINLNSSSTSESDLFDSDEVEDEEEYEEEEENEEDEEDDSDASSKRNPNFVQELDEYMNKLKTLMDRVIETNTVPQLSTSGPFPFPVKHPLEIETPAETVPVPVRNPNSRRNSMLPGSEMCNEILAFNDSLKPNHNQMLSNKTSEFTSTEIVDNCGSETTINKNPTNHNDNSPDLLIDVLETEKVSEPVKELKTLISNNEVKQTQVKKIQLDLDGAHEHIKELDATMKIKIHMFEDIQKNIDLLKMVIEKSCHKMTELQKKYSGVKTQLSPRYIHSRTAHKKRMDVYKYRRDCYRKRLIDIEMIYNTAVDSYRRMDKIRRSAVESESQMKNLKQQLKEGEKCKQELEEELAEDQKKMHDLEEKYNLTASKLKEMQSKSEGAKTNNKPKTDHPDKQKHLLVFSARISHLDHVLKEKSIDLERTADIDEKEALRHEIQNLRRIRDCLVDEKCDLDEKFQKEKTLSTVEERKLLECGETIEAIDAMIEHKNEMICGRKDFDENQSQREKGERMLMERLAKLSDGEMRTLFYKYFLKVIDLKESSRNLEVQAAELESHVETQEWQIQTLTNALKQTELEAEKRMVSLMRKYEQKLQAMYRHFAQETSSSEHETLHTGSELAKYKRENEILRKELADVKAFVRTIDRIPIMTPTTIQGPLSPTTKVTKERNKLIIQKTTDRNKRKD